MIRSAGICVILAAATWWVYADTLRFDFVAYDDTGYIVENPNIALGLSRPGLVYAFTTTDMFNWHPLTWISYLIDYEFNGLRAAGYHVTNVVLHVLNTLLLFLVLRVLTRAEWQSALVAALFGLHPLHVESVAWISERKDMLSTCFALLAIGAYAAHARSPSFRRYLLVALLLGLGLMAKPMLVTLPLLLLLLDYWPLERWRGDFADARRLAIEKVPLLLMAFASAAITLAVQRGSGAAKGLPGSDEGVLIGVGNLANAAHSYVAYLGKMFWPGEHSVLYPHPSMPWMGGTPLVPWQVAGAVVLLAVITAVVLRSGRRYAVVGWFWYGISLLPVIGIIQAGSQALADRYTYVPLIGLFIVIAWGGGEMINRLRPTGRAVMPIAGIVVGVTLLVTAVAARRATAVWHDPTTLYEHALAVNPRNALIRLNMGHLLMQQRDFEGAVEHLSVALAVNPNYLDAHNNIGIALLNLRRYDDAIQHYCEMLRIDPNHAIAHNHLGTALSVDYRGEQAIYHFRRAIELGLTRADTHHRLGDLLRERRTLAEATEQYRRALEIDPDHPGARSALAATQRGGVARDTPRRSPVSGSVCPAAQ